jgi:hypothetical protein
VTDLHNNTIYTETVIDILNAVQSPLGEESLHQHAQDYFENIDANKAKVARLREQISLLVGKLNSASKDDHKQIMARLVSLETELKNENTRQESLRIKRLNHVLMICLKTITASENKDFDSTQQRSSKFLGTTLLLSPGHGEELSEAHNRMKPAYKAVLSLRLLDKLLIDKETTNKHILEHYEAANRYDIQNFFDNTFAHTVVLPIMLAALLQDIGLLHPQLIAIQKGEEGTDLFRVLEPKERTNMLKLSHNYTLQYMIEGLGLFSHTGDSKERRAEFEILEKKRLQFQAQLLKDAFSPELGIGDFIKIPQIYASVVLSTKRDYQRKNLPTAAILIDQLGQKKAINGASAKTFISIVGYFPQGYGISYIPTDLRGFEIKSYEFCIVISLNPANPQEPICRKVTRNLAYIVSGESETIKKTVNLHYALTRKKITKVDNARLTQILKSLRHNFDPKDVPDMVPTYWEPYEYFFMGKRQNLWTKSAKS